MADQRLARIAGRIAWMAVVALAACTSAQPVRAGQFTGIVSFGDSLSDVGNTFLAAGLPPDPPYYQGRYSNGLNWLDYLAKDLGIAGPVASLAGGSDYAWGGAQTGDGLSFMGTPNIGMQVDGFLMAGGTLTGSQLVTIWGGANDFLNAGLTDPAVAVANLSAAITKLAAAGASQFIVPNLPLLGELPVTNTLPDAVRQALDGLTMAFNAMLAQELTKLDATLGITIHQLDIATVFQEMLADPSKYGLTNVTDSALDSGNFTGAGYLFWDNVHPTTSVQERIGHAAAATVIPEPSSLALLAIGGCAVVPMLRPRARRRAA
ncbi:SGNH/GDSL hydrolase family protein [Aquisphaera insulae]|uniref:SGNH/GDSL hydrolase family protein n=1 Tax=Aquisphaera insulae TaxID=2712864 RepID=UPI0013EC89BA|nr:SGNH/GDSL hydrolase family protein [Aquisphaera insulae]